MLKILPTVLLIFFTLSGASVIAAQSSFYQGKTIRMIVGFQAGDNHDQWMRFYARFLGKHIPGNPDFVVQNMHPEDVAGADKMNPYGLKLICGNPADSALCFGFLTYSGVFDRFPNLKLCILHGGGFFPYHLGRFDRGWEVRAGPRAAKARMAPSAYLKNIYYDDMIYRLDTIKYLIGLGGVDHIMTENTPSSV